MDSPEENIVSEYYDNYKETQAYIFKINTRKTRNMIFTIAILLFIGDMLSLLAANAVNAQTFLIIIIFPAIFTGLGFLAIKQPLMAIGLSMVIFAIIIVLTFIAMGSASLISGLIVKAIIIFCLIAGFNNAREAEKARKEME